MYKSAPILLAGAVLSGCVATPPLREAAVDTNRLVAHSADQQTLLNILRTSDRMPMHFTSFTELRGNLQVATSAELGVSIPGVSVVDQLVEAVAAGGTTTTTTTNSETFGASTASPKVSASVTSNPGFNMVVYDSKQFQSGIQQPVSPTLVEFFLSQGWPDDFLAALFIARATYSVKLDSGGEPVTAVIQNDPDNLRFGEMLNHFRLTSVAGSAQTDELFPLSAMMENLELDELTSLAGSPFDIAMGSAGGAYAGQVVVTRRTARPRSIGLQISGSGYPVTSGELFDELQKQISSSEGYEITCSRQATLATFAAQETESADGAGGEKCRVMAGGQQVGEISVEVVLRSPESVIYYLGAYTRQVLDGADYYKLPGGEKVIEVRRGSARGSLVNVEHNGERYAIHPATYTNGNPDHRGTQAVVIAQQLINLHKEADSLPVTNTFNLVP